MNFRQLDLNLLRVLCAIHRTGSVTEAGQQLALSQSATSNAPVSYTHLSMQVGLTHWMQRSASRSASAWL